MKKRFSMLLICSWLMLSCLTEDMSNCPEQIRVYFTFLDSKSTEVNPMNYANVDRMCLYVFSHNGLFLNEYKDENIALFSADYFFDCTDLVPGNYRFIVWGGKDEAYYSTMPDKFVTGKTTYDEAMVKLKHEGNILSVTPRRLFHSDLKAATVTNEKIQHFVMPLVQVTNTINITTKGLSADNDKYTFQITDNNCSYNFDRSFATPHAMFTYSTPCAKDQTGQLSASLTVMQLSANRRIPKLQVYNETSATLLYPAEKQSDDLIALILAAYPKNDFERVSTYDIVINYETNILTSITINGWEVKMQNNDLTE